MGPRSMCQLSYHAANSHRHPLKLDEAPTLIHEDLLQILSEAHQDAVRHHVPTSAQIEEILILTDRDPFQSLAHPLDITEVGLGHIHRDQDRDPLHEDEATGKVLDVMDQGEEV